VKKSGICRRCRRVFLQAKTGPRSRYCRRCRRGVRVRRISAYFKRYYLRNRRYFGTRYKRMTPEEKKRATECSRRWRLAHPKKKAERRAKRCLKCKTPFIGTKRRRFCCAVCGRRWWSSYYSHLRENGDRVRRWQRLHPIKYRRTWRRSNALYYFAKKNGLSSVRDIPTRTVKMIEKRVLSSP
jgi:hypothetical protein